MSVQLHLTLFPMAYPFPLSVLKTHLGVIDSNFLYIINLTGDPKKVLRMSETSIKRGGLVNG